MVEVRELIIKAVVQQSGTPKTAPAPAAANGSMSGNEEIIKACVDKVMEILKDKNER